MFERIRCMDGGVVLREVVIIHTVWNRVAIPSGYLPETVNNIVFQVYLMLTSVSTYQVRMSEHQGSYQV